MIVLKIIGWTLLGVLALIVLALAVRVRFDVEYSSENTSLTLGWLFLKLKLYPRPAPAEKAEDEAEDGAEESSKKKKKKKKKKPEKEEEEEEKKAKKPKDESEGEGGNMLTAFYDAEGFDGVLTLLKKACSYLKTFFGSLLSGFVVDEFYLDMRCTRSDAAETALYYGEVCAAVFPMLGALASRCRLKKYDVRIYPDFIARFSDASFVLRFHFTPLYLIGISVALVFRLLFGVLLRVVRPRKKKKPAGKVPAAAQKATPLKAAPAEETAAEPANKDER